MVRARHFVKLLLRAEICRTSIWHYTCQY